MWQEFIRYVVLRVVRTKLASREGVKPPLEKPEDEEGRRELTRPEEIPPRVVAQIMTKEHPGSGAAGARGQEQHV